jgi:hypothetical protein
MSQIDLVQLGNDCASGIIINDMLQQRVKNLFMLGLYEFNQIVNYLNSNNYENIYNRDLLEIRKDGFVYHKIHNFQFKHDYKLDDTNTKIINYDFVKDRFDTKIKNFKEMLLSDKKTILVNFTHSLRNMKIKSMIDWFNINKKGSNFHLILFTDDISSLVSCGEKFTIIKLSQPYMRWFNMDIPTKHKLYREIYTKFINRLIELNIVHSFPNTYDEISFDIMHNTTENDRWVKQSSNNINININKNNNNNNNQQKGVPTFTKGWFHKLFTMNK